MWAVVAIFALLSVIFLSGRGSTLIAGYNTSTAKEKAQYNEKKLCRVMGSGMGVITVVLAITASYQENLPPILILLVPVIIIVTAGVMIVLANTICKNKSMNPVEVTKEEQHQTRSLVKYTWIFTIVVIVVISFLLVTGDVKVDLKDNMLYITGSYWKDQPINYEDIQSISYAEEWNVGTKINGLDSFKLKEGHFKNSDYGDYILYIYTRCNSYIIIEAKTETYVINTENSTDTEKLYKELKEKIDR